MTAWIIKRIVKGPDEHYVNELIQIITGSKQIKSGVFSYVCINVFHQHNP